MFFLRQKNLLLIGITLITCAARTARLFTNQARSSRLMAPHAQYLVHSFHPSQVQRRTLTGSHLSASSRSHALLRYSLDRRWQAVSPRTSQTCSLLRFALKKSHRTHPGGASMESEERHICSPGRVVGHAICYIERILTTWEMKQYVSTNLGLAFCNADVPKVFSPTATKDTQRLKGKINNTYFKLFFSPLSRKAAEYSQKLRNASIICFAHFMRLESGMVEQQVQMFIWSRNWFRNSW